MSTSVFQPRIVVKDSYRACSSKEGPDNVFALCDFFV